MDYEIDCLEGLHNEIDAMRKPSKDIRETFLKSRYRDMFEYKNFLVYGY